MIIINSALIILASFANIYLFLGLLITFPLLLLGIFKKNEKRKGLSNYYSDDEKTNMDLSQFGWPSRNVSLHSLTKEDLEVTIGNNDCRKPYTASVFNVKVKNIPGIGTLENLENMDSWHLITGEDILQIGPGNTGARTSSRGFDSGKFKQYAGSPTIKMIELDLSFSNLLRQDVVSPDETQIISSLNSETKLSDFGYTVFSEEEGMINFLETLRKLSGGKPVGIRLHIRSKKEFYRICHAIQKTRIIPDFIVVEGSDKIPGFVVNANPSYPPLPLYEALSFVSKTLESYRLDKEIKVIAVGKITSGFDLVKLIALGANAVRGEMPGYRIIKSNQKRIKELLEYKKQDVADFHNHILSATLQIMNANGFRTIGDITLSKLFRRMDTLFSDRSKNIHSSSAAKNNFI